MQCSETKRAGRDREDRQLLRRVAARDGQAFEILYSYYAPRVRAYLTRRLTHHDLVDEALNDVMLVLWQQAERCPPAVPLIAWLYGIARHKAQKAMAKHRLAAERPKVPEIMTSNFGPEHTFLHDEQGHLLARAMEPLPPHERTAIQMVLHQGKSYQEIAEQMRTSVNTVKSWIRRGRHRLATRVAGLEAS